MENIISDKAIEEVMTKIDVLATKLGITAEYLWATVVKQAYVDFSANIIWICIYLIFGTTYLVYLKTYSIKTMSSIKDDDGSIMNCSRLYEGHTDAVANLIISLIFGIMFIILTAVIVGNIRGMITSYFNPEYWAFARISNLIR